MTTIAYRAGILAADTQGTRGNSRIRVRKIQRLDDGSLFAGAGAFPAIVKVHKWANAGMPDDKLPKLALGDDGEVECLIVRPDGTIVLVDEALTPETLVQEFVAIGTGCEYALGAMACGRTAARAVKIAARFDTNTSEPIETMQLVDVLDRQST